MVARIVAKSGVKESAAPAGRDAPNPGRLALILAAEKLVALHGLRSVSLRQINEAAGHKNSGATHYHFGSRDGLIQAVLDYHVTRIAARRDVIIERLKQQPAGLDVRGLVAALAQPLVEELKPRRQGNFYLRFSERIRRERDAFQVEYSFPIASWRFAQQELLRRLAHLPQPLATLRVQMVLDHIISGLAGIEAKIGPRAQTTETFIAIETLIDFIAAGVMAPPAAEVTAALSGKIIAIPTKPDVNAAKKKRLERKT